MHLQLFNLHNMWHSDDKSLLSDNLKSGGRDIRNSIVYHLGVTQAYCDRNSKAGQVPSSVISGKKFPKVSVPLMPCPLVIVVLKLLRSTSCRNIPWNNSKTGASNRCSASLSQSFLYNHENKEDHVCSSLCPVQGLACQHTTKCVLFI